MLKSACMFIKTDWVLNPHVCFVVIHEIYKAVNRFFKFLELQQTKIALPVLLFLGPWSWSSAVRQKSNSKVDWWMALFWIPKDKAALCGIRLQQKRNKFLQKRRKKVLGSNYFLVSHHSHTTLTTTDDYTTVDRTPFDQYILKLTHL